MSENFRKIKKKYMTVAIAASCILGACLGVALTCALAVILKTGGVSFHWALYIPVALVISAGAAVGFFFILRPDDKRIAKKLDRDFGLNQKVQTMVEFAHVEGDIPALQREQTDEALGAVAKKRVDLKWLLKFAVIPLVAAAMLLAGIFVPAKKSVYVDPPYDITTAQETSLKNLIEDVRDSSLQDELKDDTIEVLGGLLDALQTTEHQSTMKKAVISAVGFIDGLVANSNSYLKIHGVLKEKEELKSFSTAVVNGVVNYKSGATLTSMDAVKEKEKTVDENVAKVLTKWKDKYLDEFTVKSGEASQPVAAEEAAVKLLEFAGTLADELSSETLIVFAPESGDAGAARSADGDAFYNCLVGLCEILTKHAEGYESYDDASFYTVTAGYFGNFIDDGSVALGKQSYNCMMDEYIRNRLATIFGLKRAELPSNLENVAPYPTQDQSSSGGDKDPNAGEGGYGDGSHKYGSNEDVLDVDSGEKKNYGDLIDPDRPENGTLCEKYYNRAFEYIQDGKCSGDVAAYIKQYFAYLNNGLEEQN